MDNIKYLCFISDILVSGGVPASWRKAAAAEVAPHLWLHWQSSSRDEPDPHLLINSRPSYLNRELRLRFMGSFQRHLNEGYSVQSDSTRRGDIFRRQTGVLLPSQKIWVFYLTLLARAETEEEWTFISKYSFRFCIYKSPCFRQILCTISRL